MTRILPASWSFRASDATDSFLSATINSPTVSPSRKPYRGKELKPAVFSSLYILSPSIGRQSEVFASQISERCRRFTCQYTFGQLPMLRIPLGFAAKDPTAGLGTEDVLLFAHVECVGRVVARRASTQRQLTEITEDWERAAMHRRFVLSARPNLSPAFFNALPHGFDVIPVFRVFPA